MKGRMHNLPSDLWPWWFQSLEIQTTSMCALSFWCSWGSLFTQSTVVSIWTPWSPGLNFSGVDLNFFVKPRNTWTVFHLAYCVKPAKWNFKNVGIVCSVWTLKRFLPQFSRICFCCDASKTGTETSLKMEPLTCHCQPVIYLGLYSPRHHHKH